MTTVHRSRFTVHLLAIGCLLSAGCVRRQLTIRTEPPGATVFINEEKRGVTPYSFDFVWYGRYRISLKRDGYERLDTNELIKAPWYVWVPVDLFSELAPNASGRQQTADNRQQQKLS